MKKTPLEACEKCGKPQIPGQPRCRHRRRWRIMPSLRLVVPKNR